MRDMPEDLITLQQAAALLPQRRRGRKTHVATLYRWTSKGCRGVKLEFVQIGGTRCTSREALGRFFERLTEAATGQAGDAPRGELRSPAARSRAIEQAERELDRLGV